MARWPRQPVIRRSTSSRCRAKREPAGAPASIEGAAQHPAAYCGGQGVEPRALQAAGLVAHGQLGLGGPGVQGVGVVAGELGGTGEGFDDAFAERLLQGGQPFVAEPGAGVGGVDVVRVVPDGDRLDQAGLAGGLPVELEEGAAVAAGRSGGGGHAGERADAGAAGEAEEDGFGLVVAGVAEQDGGGAVAFGGGVQRGVAGVAGGGFGAALASDVHGDGLDGSRGPWR